MSESICPLDKKKKKQRDSKDDDDTGKRADRESVLGLNEQTQAAVPKQ